MSASIGPATDRTLVAATAVVVLVVTATFMPAATLDVLPPGSASAGSPIEVPTPENVSSGGAEGWEHVVVSGNGTGTSGGGGAGGGETTASIHVNASRTEGWLIPGREVVLTVARDEVAAPNASVEVDGEHVGETDGEGRLVATVPWSETVNVTATLPDGTEGARSLDVEDDVDVRFEGYLSRFDPVPVTATIQGFPFDGAEVSVDGDARRVLDDNGTAEVALPAEGETAEVVARRDGIEGRTELDLDLDASIDPGYPIAASRIRVDGAYPDHPADVEVYVVRGDQTERAAEVVANRDPDVRTNGSEATVHFPPASEATVIVTDGETVHAVAYDDLLRNLALAIIVAVSVGGGLAITTARALRWLDVGFEGSGDPLGLGWLARALGELGRGLVDAAAALAALPGRLSLPSVRLPRLHLPSLSSLSLPTLALPRLTLPRLSMPSLSLPSLSLPSLSLSGLSVPSLGRPSLLGRDADDEDEDDGGVVAPTAVDEDGVPTLSDRQLIRAAVRDLGRLAGVRRVETATPGQIGRRAIDAALPGEPVQRIVETVRHVEYGGARPSRDMAMGARDAVRRILESRDDGGEDA